MLTVSAPHESVVLIGVGLALLAVLAWGLFGALERQVSAQCVLKYRGERHAVVAGSTARVVSVLADAGDMVEEGQRIAKVRVLELEEQAAMVRVVALALAAQSGEASDARLRDLEEMQAPDAFIVSPRTGELAERNIVPGEVVEAGTVVAVVREGAEREFEAVALVTPGEARRIEIGMQAHALPASSARAAAQRLEAEVAEVSRDSAAPDVLLTNEDAPTNGSLVRLTLKKRPASGLRDYEPCSVHIVLGRSSPVSLLLSSAIG